MSPSDIRIVDGVGLGLGGVAWLTALLHADAGMPLAALWDFVLCSFLLAFISMGLQLHSGRIVIVGLLFQSIWLFVSPWVLNFGDRRLLMLASLFSGGVLMSAALRNLA